MIVIAPEVKHGDTAELCNFESYMSRAWCRAEQASHLLTKGFSEMYVEMGDGLKPVSKESQANALCVMDGAFTCCCRGHPGGSVCDRERLVDALLFLYMDLKRGHSPEKTEVLALVDNHTSTMFPAEYQYVTEGSKPTARTLFGNIVGVLDGMLLSGEVDTGSVVKATQTKVVPLKAAKGEDENAQCDVHSVLDDCRRACV